MSDRANATFNGTANDTISGAASFPEALYDAGTRYCFVNLGSDHPAILETMAAAKTDESIRLPKIITCPSELVALSAALGYAQVTGEPFSKQAVIVHVDCSTLALGQSIHNASVGRVPVLMFAGLSPVTQEGELTGSRAEFIHWLQDVPDQAAIVRQYCKYTAEVRTSHNFKQITNRALQIATSDPNGPVYITASRESLEQHAPRVTINQERWGAVVPGALPEPDVSLVADALINAQRPLIVTGYSGRNKGSVPAQNSVLPYPDQVGFFATTKHARGRGADTEVKSRRVWAAVWVKDTGPSSLLRELGLKEKCLAYDANLIMNRAEDEGILRTGGKLQANADVELTVPYTSLYTAEWHGLSNCELEDRLCHDAVYIADREAQIEAIWRTQSTVVGLDDCAEAYRLSSHSNAERLEANDEPDTLSSDACSRHRSDDVWGSKIGSGDESEYNPRKSRQNRTLKKRTERKV